MDKHTLASEKERMIEKEEKKKRERGRDNNRNKNKNYSLYVVVFWKKREEKNRRTS